MLRSNVERGHVSVVMQGYKRYRVSSQRFSKKPMNVEFVLVVDTHRKSDVLGGAVGRRSFESTKAKSWTLIRSAARSEPAQLAVFQLGPTRATVVPVLQSPCHGQPRQPLRSGVRGVSSRPRRALRGGGRGETEPDERRRVDQEPRFHRLFARADHVAGRREGPPLSFRRRAEAVLEELVDPRRPAEPGAVGRAVRGRTSAACSSSPTTCLGDRAPLPAEELFECRGSLYGFMAVPLSDYAAHAHPISPRWDTWAMPAGDFRRLARPLAELLGLDGA